MPRHYRVAGRDGGTELAVEDAGPGIAPADLPHVFEPFFRSASAREAGVRGVGLGWPSQGGSPNRWVHALRPRIGLVAAADLACVPMTVGLQPLLLRLQFIFSSLISALSRAALAWATPCLVCSPACGAGPFAPRFPSILDHHLDGLSPPCQGVRDFQAGLRSILSTAWSNWMSGSLPILTLRTVLASVLPEPSPAPPEAGGGVCRPSPLSAPVPRSSATRIPVRSPSRDDAQPQSRLFRCCHAATSLGRTFSL